MFEKSWSRRGQGAIGLVVGAAIVAGACSRGGSSERSAATDGRISPKTGTSASQRLYSENQQIPKGGGTYKIGAPYKVSNRLYVPTEDPNYDRLGLASWYGSDFHGRKTANGEIFDMNALTAAHPTLPIPSYAYVTNLSNNRTILVRINDRGPYANDRMIDLSRRSARELGFELHGLTKVRVKYAGRAPLNGSDFHEQRFLASQRQPQFASSPLPPAATQRPIDQSYAATTQGSVAPSASSIPSGLTWRR